MYVRFLDNYYDFPPPDRPSLYISFEYSSRYSCMREYNIEYADRFLSGVCQMHVTIFTRLLYPGPVLFRAACEMHVTPGPDLWKFLWMELFPQEHPTT